MNADVVHRLGVVMCAATGVLWLVSAVGAGRQRWRTRRRLDAVLAGAAPERPGSRDTAVAGWGEHAAVTGREAGSEDRARGVAGWGVLVRGAARQWLPVAGAMCAGYVLVGGVLGGSLGVLGAGAVWWWQRRPRPVDAFDKDRAARELPLAADLLAACIAAGADPVTAARVVGECLDGPVGERLARGAAEMRLGGVPAASWRPLAVIPSAAPLARLLERAGDSGAPAAAPVARLAAEARAERGRSVTATARRAGVLITAPVGLCFLPAFLAVGVLPVVIGLAGRLLNAGAG